MEQRFIPCPSNNEGCKYAPDCFLSTHHLWPKHTSKSRLERVFGNLASNKVRVCRNIHDVLDTFPAPEYPNPSVMRNAIQRERGRRA